MLGWLALLAAALGVFLPLLPTVPFLLLAAFLFSRGNQKMEAWLLQHRQFGPSIQAWRADRSIGLRAKSAATAMLALGALIGLLTLPSPVGYIPLTAAVIATAWILTRKTSTRRA